MQHYSTYRQHDINEDAFDDHHPNGAEHAADLAADVKLRRIHADSNSIPILHRALSTVSANQTLVSNQRTVLASNYRRTSINDEIVTIDHNDAEASFILPNLFELPEDIRNRVMESLVDTPTMVSLEETKRLNWWAGKKLPYPKLYPLVTTGDGNCLLHATSLAMWGFHDHSLSMRKALNETLITSKPNNSLYRRWRWAQSVQNKKYGLVFSEQEWNEEWKSLLRLSSAEPRTLQTKPSDSNPSPNEPDAFPSTQGNAGGSIKSCSQSPRQYYESLEEFHVYVLANNIRRPIVVYSDTILRTNDGEAISPIEFGGIYLPLEIPPDKCHKQPVFLAFDAAHFSALVPMEPAVKGAAKPTYRIPLIDLEALDLLPIHFLVDPGLNFQWPVDQELSDEQIHRYPNYEESRMSVLEKYLSLSKEYSLLSRFQSQASNSPDDQGVTDDQLEPYNEIVPSAPAPLKKPSRPSFNSFSKIIRRTFIHPFSSAKRASLKNQNGQPSSSTLINENSSERRKSSPLFNRHTNILTIIVTNFQPKQPKSSDNLIKNYIDACMHEYNLEKNERQFNDDHENLQNIWPATSQNGTQLNSPSNHHYADCADPAMTNTQSTAYRRPYPSSAASRYANGKLADTAANHPNEGVVLTRIIAKNGEEPLAPSNGHFPNGNHHVQQAQRKITQSPRMIAEQYHYLESRRLSDDRLEPHPSQKLISSSLKRQQSSSSDKHAASSNLIDYTPASSTASANINKRTPQLAAASSTLMQHKRL